MSKIVEIPLFVTSCYSTYVDDVNHTKIIDAIEMIQETQESNHLSNIGGFQSFGIDVPNWDNPETLKLFKDHIIPAAYQIAATMQLPAGERKLSYWYNINTRHSYNRDHTHPLAYISGVYYLKVPKNSGNIHFMRAQTELDRMDFITKDLNPKEVDNTRVNTEHWFEPKEGLLLMFPGHLNHYVGRNLTTEKDDRRISVSFNFW